MESRSTSAKFYPDMVVKSKWEEWRNGWFLVVVPEALECLQEPKKHPESHELWRSLSQQDVFLSMAVSRFKLLWEQGVSGGAIIAHALRTAWLLCIKGLTRPGASRVQKTLPTCGTPTWTTPPFSQS